VRFTVARRLAIAALALGGCGDERPPGAPIHHDAGDALDAAGTPPPPALGAQIDRMGRPLIGTALIGAFAAAQDQAAIADAYNRASDPAAWRTTVIRSNVTIEAELEANLAVFDAWDTGLTTVAAAGCGNGLRYLLPAKPPGPESSYEVAADLFADDEIYIDTSRTSCSIYLELEIANANSAPHTTCGGRTPSHDVVDVMYSVLAAGTAGLEIPSSNYAPKLHDGVAGPHADVKETAFPFLGPPHP
jgi:hypothetical protein